MNAEEKSRYFQELTLNLQRGGFTVGLEVDGILPVELDSQRLCQITDSGGVRYWKEDVASDMDDSPSLFASATRLLHHMGRVFQDQSPAPVVGFSFVDSKLRRKIREKKIAMGHKADDHEEQTQTLA